MSKRIRDNFLGIWGRTVTKRPLLTLLICLSIAAGSLVLTLERLEFHGDRGDLMDPNLAWNARYNNYRLDFPRWDDLVICLEGDATDARITNLAMTLANELRKSPKVFTGEAGRTCAGGRYGEAVGGHRYGLPRAHCAAGRPSQPQRWMPQVPAPAQT